MKIALFSGEVAHLCYKALQESRSGLCEIEWNDLLLILRQKPLKANENWDHTGAYIVYVCMLSLSVVSGSL